ncbi:MAG: hypothetical protein HQL57_10970 [Magnetococcales bacterium]|nr:hypothetical protein [Magnetococcales bacterium]
MAEYGRIAPDFPERIFRRFEVEGDHRATMEREAWCFQRRGQWMAFVVAVFTVTVSLVLTLAGHDWVGGVLGGGTVVGLVGVFVTGRMTSRKEERTGPALQAEGDGSDVDAGPEDGAR